MNIEKEKIAIERLKSFEPKDKPYFLCYSGGKDSDVIRILANVSGVKHEIHHNLTSVDSPVTVKYVKSIPDIHIDLPRRKDGTRITMWNLIPEKLMPPTRLARYCCESLKEQGGKGFIKITGVRWDESFNRKTNQGIVTILDKRKTFKKQLEEQNIKFVVTNKGGIVLNLDNDENRRTVEHCYRTSSTIVNPIIDWSEKDVWEYLNYYNCNGNPLYKCGNTRIGCIGCPMGRTKKMKKDLSENPTYLKAYVSAFERMLKRRKELDLPCYSWQNGIDVLKWWLNEDSNQIKFFKDEYEKILEEMGFDLTD